MKYIMFEDFAGKAVPVIFPRRIDFAELREQVPYATVVSAGRVVLGEDGFTCYGESKELGAVAREEDAAVILRYFQQRD